MSPSGFAFDPTPEEMRAMGRTVLDAVIGWIGGLEDAPAENTADALQVAAKLEAAPAEQGDRDFGRRSRSSWRKRSTGSTRCGSRAPPSSRSKRT